MPLYPKDWGPYGWKFMHVVALAYPSSPTDEEKEDYKTFFTIIKKVLPCHLCSEHYSENLIKYPLTDTVLSSRDNLLKWTIDMHNSVNEANNTKIYDYDSAIALIKNNFVDPNQVLKNQRTPGHVNQITPGHVNQITPGHVNQITPINENQELEKSDKKDNTILYILFFLFIILVMIAVIYKKN